MAKVELNNPLIMPKVQVADSSISGRGVFAVKNFKKDELIEEAHAVLFKKPRPRALKDYVFDWDDGHCTMLLGYGCVYNHASDPNAYYRKNFETNVMNIFAKRDIKAGEEILITYGEDWFESHRLMEVTPTKHKIKIYDIILMVGIIAILILLYVITQHTTTVGL